MFSAQFTHIMIAYIFSTISPGADLAMIVRQAILQGRKHAFLTALGVGFAVFVHITYTILGLGLIISQSPLAFNIIKWVGVLYLMYIGVTSLFSTVRLRFNLESQEQEGYKKQSYLKAFFIGLGVDLLNPQAVFFFLSIFSTLVKTNTALLIQFGYGVLMAVIVFVWFIMVSYFISTPKLREKFLKASRWINWLSGIYFIGLGLDLMLQNSL